MSSPYIAHEAAAADGTARYAVHGLSEVDMRIVADALAYAAEVESSCEKLGVLFDPGPGDLARLFNYPNAQ